MDTPKTTNTSATENAQPDPNERLVQVFDTKEESEAMVVHGLLESNGIESIVIPLEAPQDILPGVGGTVIRVREEDAETARDIIHAYRTDGDAEGGEAETEASGGSAA